MGEQPKEQPKEQPFLKQLLGENSPISAIVNNLIQNSEEIIEHVVDSRSLEEAAQNFQKIFDKKEESAADSCPEDYSVEGSIEEEEEEEPAKVVHHAICDNCNRTIVGIRFKCVQCPDFDFCEACEGPDSGHDESHIFAKIYRPDQRIPQQKPKCNRGRFGGPKKRVVRLEKAVASLQEQVAALMAMKQAEKEEIVYEPEVAEPEVIEPEDVEPEEAEEAEAEEAEVERVIDESFVNIEDPKENVEEVSESGPEISPQV